jgi:hypothetical protein
MHAHEELYVRAGMCIASPMHISKPQQLNPTQVSNGAAEKIERGGEGGSIKTDPPLYGKGYPECT